MRQHARCEKPHKLNTLQVLVVWEIVVLVHHACSASSHPLRHRPHEGAETAPPAGQGGDRPLIFGSGYIYPAWKGLNGAAAVKWEEASLAAIAGMGGTLTGASFNWCDIERVRGT